MKLKTSNQQAVAEIWSGLIMNRHPVVASYIYPPEKRAWWSYISQNWRVESKICSPITVHALNNQMLRCILFQSMESKLSNAFSSSTFTYSCDNCNVGKWLENWPSERFIPIFNLLTFLSFIFKVRYLLQWILSNRNNRARCKISVVNFECISHLGLVFLLLTLSR